VPCLPAAGAARVTGGEALSGPVAGGGWSGARADGNDSRVQAGRWPVVNHCHCGSTGLTLIDDCSPGKQVVTAAGNSRPELWRPKLRGSVFVY
jgi:hypothetical protein